MESSFSRGARRDGKRGIGSAGYLFLSNRNGLKNWRRPHNDFESAKSISTSLNEDDWVKKRTQGVLMLAR